MKIPGTDRVVVLVNDLSAAKAFFLDLGLEGQGESEGERLDQIVGLDNVKTLCIPGDAMLVPN